MTNSATGAHQRIRMQRTGQAPHLHATVIPGTYNYVTGEFSAVFDVQPVENVIFTFTPDPAAKIGHYTDQNGMDWVLIG